MPHYRIMFPGEYLANEDLITKDGPRDVTLTIAKVEQEDIRTDRGTERKWCVHFEELIERNKKDKAKPNRRLVLGVTNAKSIAKLHGPETDQWVGKKITLYRTECMAFGKKTGCIRVRDRVPAAKEKEPNQ